RPFEVFHPLLLSFWFWCCHAVPFSSEILGSGDRARGIGSWLLLTLLICSAITTKESSEQCGDFNRCKRVSSIRIRSLTPSRTTNAIALEVCHLRESRLV